MTTVTEAREVWLWMRGFVLERNDRRKTVGDAVGLSYVRVKALRRIARSPVTLSELADWLVNDRPYTTLIVDALEERGLVTRSPHPDDRRRKIVTITTEGRAVLRKADRIQDEPPASLRALNPADLTELHRILSKLDD